MGDLLSSFKETYVATLLIWQVEGNDYFLLDKLSKDEVLLLKRAHTYFINTVGLPRSAERALDAIGARVTAPKYAQHLPDSQKPVASKWWDKKMDETKLLNLRVSHIVVCGCLP